MKKDLKQLFNVMEKEGWTVIHGKKHVACVPPNGKGLLTIGKTPSCCHYKYDVKRNLRSIGQLDLYDKVWK